jgi:large subunit ribosomal protein L25
MSVICKPGDIPTQIVVDVTALKIGDVIHVGELTLPPGVKPMYAPNEAVVSVVAPKVEKVAAEEVVAVEGAVPAEGAAAVPAAAAGAKPDAKAEAKPEAKPAKEAKK